ncbi:hypothetical protein [Ancylobacter oerskovii]|uniref:Glycosyltransferase family 1 protein n=1 Tax=Ancylobacter oerskovii TaxID=459519 RepID=A0ABW4YX56_9HYPH|nr:hypothetical protein [Ancylobacter oerskovii]MBS7542264.1 hypothetical protein [Ancylobacter oerskovii]
MSDGMLPVIAPFGINWFYESQAENLAQDLTAFGLPAAALASADVAALRARAGDTVLIVNYSECLIAAERAGRRAELNAALERFEHRILVNYDTVYSHWFGNQFPHDAAPVTAVVDLTMVRQVEVPFIRGVPYAWAPEAFSARERASLGRWQAGRPLPWAMLGHATADRAAFLSAAMETLGGDGFAFLPPHRPYERRSGLEAAEIARVLARADLYLWSSHHSFPYHEGFRALHAVAAGAVPAKVDPLNAAHFAHVPWVYPHLQAVREAKERFGLAALYQAAFDFIERHGRLAANVARAIAPWCPAARQLAGAERGAEVAP